MATVDAAGLQHGIITDPQCRDSYVSASA